jgi:hypothetical protein
MSKGKIYTRHVTDITYPPYTPWGIRRLWGLGGLELFGNVDIYW